MVKSKDKIDKREEKYRRVASAIANMEVGQIISPTKLFKNIQIHPDTGRDLMDMWDSLRQIGFETIRDENGVLVRIIRVNENLDLKKEISEMRKDILDIKIKLEEVKEKIKNVK
jgi:hypothetical protein